MRRITRDDYSLETLQRIVSGVTFFKELIHQDPTQFELLMSVTSFVTAEENEIILHKGEDAKTLYFLLKGSLAVLADDDTGKVINEIHAGEVFGVMAMVLNSTRSASLKVNTRNALLAGIDYQHFNDTSDYSFFDLQTKISFFRMLNNHTRWNLEQKKISSPNHPLLPKLRALPIYSKSKNTQEELDFLHTQAQQQAALLREWNAITSYP